MSKNGEVIGLIESSLDRESIGVVISRSIVQRLERCSPQSLGERGY